MSHEQPLVSIISFCKNRALTIRRSIESVLSQSYRNIEFVIQDGASTDETVDIIKSYNDPRIKLVSEPDSGPAEGFWKVLNRCEGELIGTCLSDEELLPGAIDKAVELFRENPDAGAITCDGWVTDDTGKIIDEFNAGEFNLVDYLFGKYCPFWPGSFFRRQALLDVGLKTHDWTIECLEFETWCRLGTLHEVKYVPVRMSKYAVHTAQLSNTRQYFHEHFDNRAKIIRKMFSASGFFGEDQIKLNGCLYNQLYLLYNHVRAYKLKDQEEILLGRLSQLKSSIPIWDRVRYCEYFNFLDNRFTGSGAIFDDSAVFRRISSLWLRGVLALPVSVRKRIPPRLKEFLRHSFTTTLYLAIMAKATLRFLLYHRKELVEGGALLPAISPRFSERLYHEVAKLYYARGQIAKALQLWRKAEVLGDPVIDGLACQAMLMLPQASYEDLLKAQQRWAAKHAKPDPSVPPLSPRPYDGRRKIRVGYFCSFLDSDTIRFIMSSVIRHVDRSKFEIFGYSPEPVAQDVREAFDRFRVTGVASDREFVESTRSDELDIFVELSGFSPRNRFSAMASRCAPIQISYLNHTGTSAVPNVDYIFADEISVLPGEDRWFTEKVWRLPGCFLCYNYDAVTLPPISDVPMQRNGHVTFGCFGSGGKIGDKLVAIWAEILRKVPDSILFLRNAQLTPEDNRQFMQTRFRRHGVAEDRLRLLSGTDRQTILRCYDEVDIGLDTWPYSGGNTIAESLWQGVPLITLLNARFSGRYSASLLTAAGCAALVAKTPEEYVSLAVNLSRQPEKLTYYRKELRRMANEFGLSDARQFARKLDAAQIEMMNILHNRRQDRSSRKI